MPQAATTRATQSYTPALGYKALTPLYDLAIRLLTSEATWRRALIEEIAPAKGDWVVDVGCGTGSLLLGLHKACPEAELLAVEPDPEALAISKRKFKSSQANVRWHNGFIHEVEPEGDRAPNKIVSSLVFHQVPLPEKAVILDRISQMLAAEGEFFVADYMKQGSAMMRGLFRMTVQQLDGVEDTQPNADGILEQLIAERFSNVRRVAQFNTLTGCISVWRGTKPSAEHGTNVEGAKEGKGNG